MATELQIWVCILIFSSLGTLITATLCRRLFKAKKLRIRNRSLRQEREVIFEFIHHIGELFSDADDIDTDSLLKRILFFATKTGKATAGAIYLFTPDRSQLFARAVSGIFPPLYDSEKVNAEEVLTQSQHLEAQVRTRAIAAGEGLIGSAAAVGNGIIIEDAEMDVRVPTYTDTFLKIRSLLVIPMRFGNEVLGVLVLINRTDETPFTPSDLSLLQAMADQATVPIHYAGLRAALEQKKQLDRDMQAAQQIQASLLPQSLPQLDTVQLAAYNLPAFDIGGDYYDFIEIDEDHLGIAIADVAGKGIGGAMMMAVCQGVLRTRAGQELSPARMLSELNRVLTANLAEDMFITMLYMVLNTQTRELTFARAGHERPLLCRQCNGTRVPEPLDGPGIAIGLADPEVFDATIADISIQLESGDGIIAYTDGITEALNQEGEEWGLENLTQLIRTHSPENPEALMELVRTHIAHYVGAQQQYDDMTLLALKVK
jgi:sigma-B regulation protein RsbU (phosphoserine phosphatase)